jgi:hypothetical protein
MSSITPHPILKVPTREQLEVLARKDGIEAVGKLLKNREEAIKLAQDDPLNYGFELDGWKYADKFLETVDTVFVSGGNRSSKTEYGARSVVRAALENANAEIVCFAQDNDASIRVQQRAVYRYLPPELKQKSKSTVEYLNYTVKNGFTGGSFILPNGSTIYFHTYSQFQANRSKFEGLEIGSSTPKWHNIGLWLDEYLEDGDLVNTMRFRLATRDSKMLLTFTPIDGYTPFVAEFLKNCETYHSREAEMLDGETVPYVQYSHNKDAGIVFFHSQLNPFGGYKRIRKELKNSSREEIMTRAYGIPVKSMNTLFPQFSTGVHVISDLPNITPQTHTVFQVVDPAGARNYVAIWAAVDSKGHVTILREWPDRDTFGPWAEVGTGGGGKEVRWKFSDAAKKLGYDVQAYVDEFGFIEQDMGIDVFERIGDSRYFARENEDNNDLFESFADKGMFFVPSSGVEVDAGLAALDEWMRYNTQAEVDGANRPILQIHESCKNLIFSIINWSNSGKKDEPLKDFIDLLRYLRMHNDGLGPDFVDSRSLQTTIQGSGGY